MKLFDPFPHNYMVDIEPGWPERGEREVSFSSFEPLGIHTTQYADLRFYPDGKASWVGRFERGIVQNSEDVILTTASPRHACVAVGGAGYWVDVPEMAASPLECLPITQIIADTHLGAILIITWKDILVFDSAKPRWALQDIVDDRLKALRIEGNILFATGFSGGVEVRILIDLDAHHLLESKPLHHSVGSCDPSPTTGRPS
jgi:hypothetical protein